MIVGATDQKLVVNVGKSLSGYDVAYINAIAPDKTEKKFTATVSNVPSGIMEYQLQTGDIDLAGNWVFYAEVVYLDGKIGYGKPFMVSAKNKGVL